MIEIINLHKTFNEGTANEIRALSGINIKINTGDFLVIVGANGSGKTTLLNLISGNLQLTKGTIKIEGEELSKLEEYQRSKWIARIFQNPFSGTAPGLSILDNFRLAALRTQHKKLTVGINNDFKKLVAKKISILNMGLENKLNQAMGTLSGGQRQALTLIMAIMDEAKILLLDEPTASLDPKSSEILMENVNRIVSEYKLTSILVTHRMKNAQQYGTRIVQMDQGLIIKDLSREEKARLDVKKIYDWFV